MSEKLYRLEDIMRRIFEQLKKDPSSANELQKLDIYKRIAAIENENESDDMLEELIVVSPLDLTKFKASFLYF